MISIQTTTILFPKILIPPIPGIVVRRVRNKIPWPMFVSLPVGAVFTGFVMTGRVAGPRIGIPKRAGPIFEWGKMVRRMPVVVGPNRAFYNTRTGVEQNKQE